ncbi:hypothetical protein ATO46_16535 [Aeromonas schubertii]|uniref:hypothetical protein n=1 Tax=Aeromonas schubertii TaxID=652 RepID=UPI00067F3180|nr:hypothetical protein [Aeromonas schubertii]KUE80057.1 hypothetical protein ATO46_16535 [Aeromonas schubertii]
MIKRLLSVGVVVLLAGCATFQGGMPDLPFNTEEELGIVKANLKDAASVNTYYNSPSLETRNKFIASRLVITNIEYLKYIKNLSAEESQIHSATDILVLSLDVAATAFSPVTTKTILSSLSSVTGGTRMAIDKNAYADKAMSALVSAMNAQRKEVLKRIVVGSAMSLNGYTFEQALSDINDYYLAGTINGALSSIQRDAAVKEAAADSAITVAMGKRDSNFVDANIQARVDKMLGAVSKLTDQQLFDLVSSPPVTNAEIAKVVAARDPGNLRANNRDAAIKIIKMMIVLSNRDEKSLFAWEASVKSVAN